MSDHTGLPRLRAGEAAARLGVKPETLYAYVSRGLLSRQRDARGSSFDPLEVETFAARRSTRGRPSVTAGGQPSGKPLMIIETDLALLEDDELYYRDRRVADLVGELDFESVCRWVWTGDERAELSFVAPPVQPEAELTRALGPGASSLDRIHLAVVLAAGRDPLRHDQRLDTVARQAAALLPTMIAGLALLGRPAGRAAGLAGQLWPRLSRRRAVATHRQTLDAALTLLLDHDLAASTLAVRAAASARANPYAAISAGLGALDSALHGNASRAAYDLLARVIGAEPVELVVAETVAGAGGVPGFGHRVYRRTDPRAQALLGLLEQQREAQPAVAAYRAVEAAVTGRIPTFANVDLALAALAHAYGMGPDAGTAIFAIGRTAGWVAHIVAEYEQPPLRLRPIGRYAGPG